MAKISSFPLILLQAKAGGSLKCPTSAGHFHVSINSPSGEGGGKKPSEMGLHKGSLQVSINSPSGEGGGNQIREIKVKLREKVSINSPSGEGGGRDVLGEKI